MYFMSDRYLCSEKVEPVRPVERYVDGIARANSQEVPDIKETKCDAAPSSCVQVSGGFLIHKNPPA